MGSKTEATYTEISSLANMAKLVPTVSVLSLFHFSLKKKIKFKFYFFFIKIKKQALGIMLIICTV